MDEVMLEILKEQKNKGKKKKKTFSSEAYRKVIAKINERFSLNISRTKVLNHLKTPKEQMVLEKVIDLKNRIR
jgi:hypothetical protein